MSKARIAKGFSVQVFGNDTARLNFAEFDGREHAFLVHATAIPKVIAHLMEAADTLSLASQASSPSRATRWHAPLHTRKEWEGLAAHWEAGPNGSHHIGVTADGSEVALRFRSPENVQLAMTLPPEDAKWLLEKLAAAVAAVASRRAGVRH